MKNIRIIAICVGVVATIFFILPASIQNYKVVEDSMAPSIQQGDYICVSKIIYRFVSPQRGDVIVFRPQRPKWGAPFIKRVIALPGESVEIRDGRIRINGIGIDEPYVIQPARYVLPRLVVAPDGCFVLGDSRNNSVDSREGWTVPRQNIVGKVWLIYWPPSRLRLVGH